MRHAFSLRLCDNRNTRTHMNKTNSKKFTAEQDYQLNALAAMKDEDIDFSDIPEQLDWSSAKRGKFYKSMLNKHVGRKVG
jgi:hypothetical protein